MTSAERQRADEDRDLLARGVAPTRKPVFRSCEVVPPFDAAMQTIAADRQRGRRGTAARSSRAGRRSGRSAAAWRRSCRRSGSTTSRSRRSAATRRSRTGSRRRRSSAAPTSRPVQVGRHQVRRRRSTATSAERCRARRASSTGRARSGAAPSRRRRRRRRGGRAGPSRSTPMIGGRARNRLMMPPAATAPAPM